MCEIHRRQRGRLCLYQGRAMREAVCGCGERLDCTAMRCQVGVGASALAFCGEISPSRKRSSPSVTFKSNPPASTPQTTTQMASNPPASTLQTATQSESVTAGVSTHGPDSSWLLVVRASLDGVLLMAVFLLLFYISKTRRNFGLNTRENDTNMELSVTHENWDPTFKHKESKSNRTKPTLHY